MIITRLWGGLGNQMFQYAFGYAKAKRANTELVLDTRFFTERFLKENPRFTKQKLNLFKFPIDFKQTINENCELRKVNMFQRHRINQVLRIPYISVLPADKGLRYVKETRMRLQPFLASMNKDNRYYDGYWQTEKYFADCRDDLSRQFAYQSERADAFAVNSGVRCPNAVAVHMRMGDYGQKHLSAHYNYVINPDYYQRAIMEIRKRIAEPRFFVCSNNIKKAKELLGHSSEYTYVSDVDGMTDLDEFSIMQQCQHHIMSNSTFSWWAAWLGEKQNTINIAPGILFGSKDIIPDRWIKVNASE
jgi:Glycosyl transferase family 11.